MTKIAKPNLDQFCASLDAREYRPESRSSQHIQYSEILKEIRFHADERYWQFTPSYTEDFEERLCTWLNNPHLTRADQALLLRLVPEMQFIDRDDLLSLYRSAYLGPISRWLFDTADLDFSHAESTTNRRFEEVARHTWFCPATDSMDIAQFLHVNGLVGADQRPAWRVLKEFGAKSKISRYCAKHGYKRVVILEDFVGSGTQTAGPLIYAARQLSQSIPILFVPLIASSVGLEHLQDSLKQTENVTLEPVFVIPRLSQLHGDAKRGKLIGENSIRSRLRKLVTKTFSDVRKPGMPGEPPLKKAFGFGGLGMLLVLYTNCPNNTIPLVWHSNTEWKALFPRVSRK